MRNSYWKEILMSLSLVTQVGLAMAISVIVGIFAGRFLDGVVGTRLLFTILGTLLGVGGGLVHTYRLLQKAMKGEDNGGGSEGDP